MEQYKEKLRSALQGCTTPQEIHNGTWQCSNGISSENWQKSKNAHLNMQESLLFFNGIFSRKSCF